MAEVINLKVDADRLVGKARNVSDAVDRMRKDFDRLDRAIDETKKYWKGTAGDSHRKLYSDQKKTIQDILRDMEKYPDDILKMAGLYREAETKNTQKAEGLKSGMIHLGG